VGRLETPPLGTASPAADSGRWPLSASSGQTVTGANGVSTVPQVRRADTIAGFLCAFSLAIAGIAIARTPGLLAPVAILIALVAARMSEAHRTLAGWAVAAGTAAFVLGMIVAISTDNALY
jgi:hypothetical protein